MQPIRTRTACKNTRWQEKHATDTWTEECAAEQTRDCTATQHDRTWSVSIRTPTRNRNSRHECQDSKTTLQYETRHADERVHGLSTLEAAHSHENKTWRECQGSVTKPWITLDRWDRTLTDWSTVETVANNFIIDWNVANNFIMMQVWVVFRIHKLFHFYPTHLWMIGCVRHYRPTVSSIKYPV